MMVHACSAFLTSNSSFCYITPGKLTDFTTRIQKHPPAFLAAEFQMYQENNSTWTLTLKNDSMCPRKPNKKDEQNGYFKLAKEEKL
jgi:hypothetical protein